MRAALIVAVALTAWAGLSTGCDDDSGGAGLCRASSCITPPTPVCEGDAAPNYTQIPGECDDSSGQIVCDYGKVLQGCGTTGQICDRGRCVDQAIVPCDGVTCFAQPPNDCSGNTAQIYASSGTCNPAIPPSGMCEYAVASSLDCGTSNKVCRDGNCIDPATTPCDPNPCNVPPPATCTGLVPVVPAATGTCTAANMTASCNYPTSNQSSCLVGRTCQAGKCATGVATPAAAGDVIITEIMRNPVGDDDTDEWFELYNPKTVAAQLDSCVISDDGTDSHTIAAAAPVIVPAEGWIVLGRSMDAAANGGWSPDYTYFGSGADSDILLANGVDEIVLTCGGVVIDAVRYAVTDWPGGSAAPGVSMSLNPTKRDAAMNDTATNWCAGSTSFGTLGNTGSPRRANPACN